MPSCFSVMLSFFLGLFFTTCNFCKLFFIVRGGEVSCFKGSVWLFAGRRCAFIYLFWFLLLLNGRGVEVNVFFSPSFDMCQEEGKGVTFFIKFFFRPWVAREGGQGFLFFRYVEGGWEGDEVDFWQVLPVVFLCSRQPFLHTVPGALSYNRGMQKNPCGCLSHLPCHVLRLCFVPLCTARSHRTGRCTFLVLNMASSVRIWSKPRMIPVSSLNGMEAFSRQNMLANTIEFHSICSVLGKTMLTRFYFFLPRFFLGFSFSESSLFFVSLVLSFFRRLLGGLH